MSRSRSKYSGRGISRSNVYDVDNDDDLDHIEGVGDYNGIFKQLSNIIAPLTGGALGMLTGLGDYVRPKFSVNKNSVLDMGLDPPQIVNSPMRNTIVRHREYITDVITGAAGVFTVNTYPIQPGSATTFPWLSTIASGFEQYRLRGCIFEFKSTSANALGATNTALGTVILATEYDVTRPQFVNKIQMENSQYAMSAKQSCSMLHPIECARGQNTIDELYIRQNDYQPSQYDPKMYDFGNFQVATYGQQGTFVNIGELWVTFEFEFLKPFNPVSGPNMLQSAHVYSTSGISTSNYFGTAITAALNNNIKVTYNGVNSLTLNDVDSGTYLFMYTVTGSSTALTPITISFNNASQVSMWRNGGASTINIGGNITAVIYNTWIVFTVTAAAPVVILSGGTLPTSATNMDAYFTSVNSNVSYPSPVPLPMIGEVINDTPDDIRKLAQLLKENGLDVSETRLKEYKLIQECMKAGTKK